MSLDVTSSLSASSLFSYFIKDNVARCIKCIKCHQKLTTNAKNETSKEEMTKHIQDHHPNIYNQLFPNSTRESSILQQNENLQNSKSSPTKELSSVERVLNEIEYNLIEAIGTFWKDEKFTDIDIYCEKESKPIKVHSLILATLSPFFKETLENIPRETDDTMNTVIILLPDVKRDLLANFFDKIYYGGEEEVAVPPDLQFLHINLAFSQSPKFKSKEYCRGKPRKLSREPLRSLSKRKQSVKDVTESQEWLQEGIYNPKNDHLTEFSLSTENNTFDEELNAYEPKQTFVNNELTECDSIKIESRGKSSKISDVKRRRVLQTQLVMFSKPKGPRMGTPSIAWIFFELVNSNTARCTVCDVLVATTFSSTSGLLKHLKIKHLAYCEQWEKDNVKNFDLSILSSTELHPIRLHFNRMETTAAWSCSYCDTVFLGINKTKSEELKSLEEHLMEQHNEKFIEYEQEKIAILCRRGKENRLHLVNSKVEGKTQNTPKKSKELGNNRTTPIKFNPTTVLKTGLSNILMSDFFVELDQGMMECTLCSGSVRLRTPMTPSNNDNISSSLWRHLKISHLDIHEKLIVEKELISEFIKFHHPKNPIWNYFQKLESSFIECLECSTKIEVKTSFSPGELAEDHLSNFHKEKLATYKESEKSVLEELEMFVWQKYSSNLDIHFQSFFERIGKSKMYRCTECKLDQTKISDIFEMSSHVTNTHKDHLFDENDANSKNSNRDIKSKLNLGEDFCLKCDPVQIFSSKTGLNFHERYLHLGERPYKCDQCSRTFIRTDELKLHKRYHEDRELKKGAMCSQCGMVFNSSASRIRHENTVHHNIRRHACKSCGKKFASSQALDRHARIHSDLKPHRCTECGQQFRELAHLKVHFRTHTGEKPISCPNCLLKFKHYAGRRSHKCEGKLVD